MKTIAEQLNIKDFPFIIRDRNRNEIYYEGSSGHWYKNEYDSNGNKTYYRSSFGYWVKKEYDLNGNRIYFENSEGKIIDNRTKPTCEGKIVEIDGKKYELKEVK
jgi:hypothetical protein